MGRRVVALNSFDFNLSSLAFFTSLIYTYNAHILLLLMVGGVEARLL